jgi:excisionase family DNA binding protein
MKQSAVGQNVPPTLLTVREICEMLRISRTTAWRWIEAGVLPARKIGRRVLIPRADVEKMLAAKTLFSRSRAILPEWFERVSPDAADRGAELISRVLRKSGVEVNSTALQPILTGDESPTPVFWNALITGLENLFRPAATPAEGGERAQALEKYTAEWERRGRPGFLWDRSTWGGTEPLDHQEEDE